MPPKSSPQPMYASKADKRRAQRQRRKIRRQASQAQPRYVQNKSRANVPRLKGNLAGPTVRAMPAAKRLLASVVAVPSEHDPIRMPSNNPQLTAVCAFKQVTTVKVPKSGVAVGVLIRSPTYPLWIEVNYDGPAFSIWREGTGLYRAGLHTLPSNAVKWYGAFKTSGEQSPLAANWPLGATNDYQGWTYVPRGMTPLMCIQLDSIPESGSTPVVGYYLWEGGAKSHYKQQLASADPNNNLNWFLPTTHFSDFKGGWFCLHTFGGFGVAANFTIRVGATKGNGEYWSPAGTISSLLLPAYSVPEFTVTTLPYQHVRCTAAASLFTNVSSALNKEGTVKAIRVPVNQYDPWSTRASEVSSYHAKQLYSGPLEKGFYSFTLGDELSDHFKDHSYVNAAGTQVPVIHLEGMEHATLIEFVDLDAATANTLQVTTGWHLEFLTTSSLLPVGRTVLTLQDCVDVRLALLDVGIHYENPVHLAAIAAMVGRALAGLGRTLAPHALDIAKAAWAGGRDEFNRKIRTMYG